MYHFVIVAAAAVATAIVAVLLSTAIVVVVAAAETLLLLLLHYTWCVCYYCFLFLFLLLFLLLCSVTAGRECLVVQPSPLPDRSPTPRAKVCSGVVLIQTVVQEPKLRRGRGRMGRLHVVRRRRRRRRHSCYASFPPTRILISILHFWPFGGMHINCSLFYPPPPPQRQFKSDTRRFLSLSSHFAI